MKNSSIIGIAVVAIVAIALAAVFIDVDQTQEAKLPDVKVEGGQAPEFEVETGSVDVTTTEEKVLVPKVIMEEETVTVPKVDVEPAGEAN